MKMIKAQNYYKMKLMSRCVEMWKSFIQSEKMAKQIEHENIEKKNKMQKFLEAAAEGKLNVTDTSSQQTETAKPPKKPEKKFSTLRSRPNSAKNPLQSAKSE